MSECLVELAWLRSKTGQPESSLAYSEEAIALFRRLDARWQEAQGRDVLAHALRLLGRYEEAMATYRRAMKAFDELGTTGTSSAC
ncbi:hypothetical protein GCM10023084_77340 [Streptomyces lacrimifluminis]|uniref:Tetratricopeptide repeat protein n=1 Tax=Streptomyces lacrimifluminis TaxID=1500077 RepID=A0A917UMC3_9ACTN|nr:tetratricopeptide repeat protein [Streptomyces lacrimifluminis]GGJ67884.1 hypothetical protein GCM10012282_76130 [Streptomyces lacrimifluminis]